MLALHLLCVILGVLTAMASCQERGPNNLPIDPYDVLMNLVRYQNRLDSQGRRNRRQSGSSIPSFQNFGAWQGANEINSNSIRNEITSKGMIIRGGADLPGDFKGSGSADFAFTGESFRPAHIPLSNQNSKLQTPQSTNDQSSNRPNSNFWFDLLSQNLENAENNVVQNSDGSIRLPDQGPSPGQGAVPLDPRVPNACQKRCHKRLTGEYNPICGSDGVTYFNPGKFNCALQCGKQITGTPNVACAFGATLL